MSKLHPLFQMESAATREKKTHLFEILAREMDKIEGQNIELSSKTSNPQRDALAFYVHFTERLFADLGWVTLVEMTLLRLHKYSQMKDKKWASQEATWMLNQDIQVLLEAVITEKIEAAQNADEKKKWDAFFLLYTHSCQRKNSLHEKGLPVPYEDIPRDFLPDWYLNNYC